MAADEDNSLRGLDDDALLRMAAIGRRIVITFDAKDFPRIHRDWAHGGNHHAGCMVLTGIDHSHFGDILRAVDSALASRPGQVDWIDLLLFVTS